LKLKSTNTATVQFSCYVQQILPISAKYKNTCIRCWSNLNANSVLGFTSAHSWPARNSNMPWL